MLSNTRSDDRPLDDQIDALFALDPDLIANPYPLYERMRAEAPVYRHADKVMVARYEDVRTVLTSPLVHQGLAAKGSRFRNATSKHGEPEQRQMAEIFGFFEKRIGGANGEHHTRLRRLASRAFTPRMVARMEERITAIAEELIAPISRTDTVEFIDAYAFHLPLIVICEMLDISPDDRDDLRRWANSLGIFVGADWSDAAIIHEAHDAIFNLKNYLGAVINERRGGSTSDLLGALIAAESDGEYFTEEELIAMIFQFVFAGHETSTMFLGNCLVSLLGDYRADWAAFGTNPALVMAATEELLRYDGPAHNLDKLAAADFVIGGVQVREGDTINIMIASANRDEAQFPRGDCFEVDRPTPIHLTLALGPHYCLGAALARMEAQVSLKVLSRRFPEMRLATDTIEWRPTHMNRGPETLPVVLGPERF